MTDTTDQLATALIEAGAWLDHDEEGDTALISLPPGGGIINDPMAVVQRDTEGDWVYITPEYYPIPLSAGANPLHLGSNPQRVLNEVARRLDDAVLVCA